MVNTKYTELPDLHELSQEALDYYDTNDDEAISTIKAMRKAVETYREEQPSLDETIDINFAS